MAVLNATRFNFVDVIKREAPNGEALLLGNSLAQTNEIIRDMLLVAGNEKLGNRSGKFTALGTASRRRANKGVTPSKASVVQQYDPVSVWADRIEIDELELKTTKDKAMIIQQELDAKRENLSIQMTYDLIYGDPAATPDSMRGLATRLNTTTIPTVCSAGGSSANTSAYIVTHDLNSFYGFYPSDLPSGLSYINRGPNQRIDDGLGSNSTFYGEVHDLQWALGITVKNERRVGRLCNIATGSLTKNAASGADLVDLFIHTQNQLQNLREANKKWYVGRVTLDYLARQLNNKSNRFITLTELDNKMPFYSIFGVPVGLVEQISNNEGTIS